MEKNEEYWNDHLDHLLDLLGQIEVGGKVTILTGGNGRGKSLIRKLIPMHLKNHLGIEDARIKSVSLDDRAGINPNKFMGFDRDCEWEPGSINTFSHVKYIEKAKDYPNGYIILDEIEIGMSEESQLGMAIFLNKKLAMLKNILGVLIITHSRHMVRHIECDTFLNIDGMTREQWLNREIVPTDFEELENNSNALYRVVQSRTK